MQNIYKKLIDTFAPMSSIRQNRVARLLQKELSLIIQGKTNELFPGTMVSVTIIRVSPDLSFAKVYLSIFGNIEPKKGIKIANENASSIRGELGRKVGKQLRITPEVAFYLDDSIDYMEEIEAKLNQ
ncbi:MAG: 30S ribosome-binding factor RbfA [Vicingaceae bacterium]|jgi:ribosome-binding factor A|nr:30S ribosome-binding factor RbfA [Vicingaceae bacterium]|tara:strand:- start:32152 stop:32532 length:381 start_codon:yes stop_codon:yes gene_type:complete